MANLPAWAVQRRALTAATILAAGALVGCGGSSGSASSGSGASSTRAADASSTTASGTTASSASAAGAAAGSAQSGIEQAVADAPISPVIKVAPSLRPSGIAAPAADVAVIRGWSDALRGGDVDAAARYFQIPSELFNGPDANGQFSEEQIGTEAQAVEANRLLPCGAKLVSTDLRGEWVNALFILSSRPGPGGGCGDTQTTSRVNFIIHAGKIVDWLIAPPQAGDNAYLHGKAPAPGGRKLRA